MPLLMMGDVGETDIGPGPSGHSLDFPGTFSKSYWQGPMDGKALASAPSASRWDKDPGCTLWALN